MLRTFLAFGLALLVQESTPTATGDAGDAVDAAVHESVEAGREIHDSASGPGVTSASGPGASTPVRAEPAHSSAPATWNAGGALEPQTIFYCAGKTTSAGCLPFMTTSGTPSVSATNPFVIQSHDHVENEAGLTIYGFAKSMLPFHGGRLCVKAPLTRLGAKSAKPAPCVDPAGGCSTGSCATLTRNFNAVIQNGSDPLLTAGREVHLQWIQRDPTDPLGFGDNLSDGVFFVIQP